MTDFSAAHLALVKEAKRIYETTSGTGLHARMVRRKPLVRNLSTVFAGEIQVFFSADLTDAADAQKAMVSTIAKGLAKKAGAQATIKPIVAMPNSSSVGYLFDLPPGPYGELFRVVVYASVLASDTDAIHVNLIVMVKD